MNKPARTPAPAASGVRPADRLGFTLFLAALVHLALILGLSFSFAKPGQISKTLEITLSTFKSAEKPKEADFLAQNNQQGSGTLDKKAAPKTTEQALFQDTEVKRVTPPSAPPASARKEKPKAAVATRSPQAQKTPVKTAQAKPQPASRPAPVFDSSQLSAEIASLEAQLAQEQQLYAKRPKIHRLNAASTMRDKGAWYKEEWRKKIERIGNLNYP
ncbi:MAG: energy transducer TonB, partial [Pseudomonas sp.]|nr:energy transducer TonB [Pseudomonas sp.]